VIFVVDSTADYDMEEVKDELHRFLREDELKDAALLVFANKQDLPDAMNPSDLADKMSLTEIKNHEWHIQV